MIKLSLFLIIIVLVFFTFKHKNLEPFISNVFGHNIYLNNDGVMPRVNDIRDQLLDFHNQYNDTHSWLWTELVPGDRAVNCTRGFLADNNYAGPDLSNYPKFYNRREKRSAPVIIDKSASPQRQKAEKEVHSRKENKEESARSWDKDSVSKIYNSLPLFNEILKVKSPLDVPHLKHERQLTNQSRESQFRDMFTRQSGGSQYDLQFKSEPEDVFERERHGQTATVTYKKDIRPDQELSDKLISDIRLVQPFYFNQVEITHRGEEPYYHDSQFPRDMLPVQYIKDPRSYCLQFKNIGKYPCYKWLSKF